MNDKYNSKREQLHERLMSSVQPEDSTMTFDDVKVNQPFYLVMALGEYSQIEQIIPLSEPYEKDYLGWFIQANTLSEGFNGEDWSVTGSRSLQDMGIIPNQYNYHKAFKTLKGAEEYLEFAKTNSPEHY